MKLLARHILPVLVATLAYPGLATAQLYRWVDDDGRIHYSDSLPPERAPDERRIYSRDGDHMRDVARAPTESEIRALEEARREAEEAQAQQKERQRRQMEYDRMLTHTYNSITQLERTRDERINKVKSQIQASLIRQERYQQDILDLEEQAARAERAGANSDPASIYQRLDQARKRLADERSYNSGKESEITRIRAEFSAHIHRFRELLGAR